LKKPHFQKLANGMFKKPPEKGGLFFCAVANVFWPGKDKLFCKGARTSRPWETDSSSLPAKIGEALRATDLSKTSPSYPLQRQKRSLCPIHRFRSRPSFNMSLSFYLLCFDLLVCFLRNRETHKPTQNSIAKQDVLRKNLKHLS